MAGHQITVTAKTGPNRANAALVLDRVENITFDLQAAKLQVEQSPPPMPSNPATPPPTLPFGSNIKEYDLVGVTTVTCTVTAGVYAFVVS